MGFEGKLSAQEIAELHGYLCAVSNGRIGSVHAMDGLITALVCTPDPRPSPDEYLSVIHENTSGGFVLRDAHEAQRIAELVARHYQSVLRSIREGFEVINGEVLYYEPLFDQDDGGNVFAETWFGGFLAGARLRPDVWDWRFKGSEDRDYKNPLDPLVQLVTQPARGPGSNPDKDPLSVEEQDKLWVQAAIGICDIYRENHPEVRPPKPAAHVETGTYIRDTPKVGRNDPCPCGSGRKYKKCCARREAVK
ncbi:UPF0149 family protein [Ruegeria sp.]|uniref:UPF0149 family protein n=1 Tax=Ruegeria sp. TaxID=1879320 RepID=UPI003C79DA51